MLRWSSSDDTLWPFSLLTSHFSTNSIHLEPQQSRYQNSTRYSPLWKRGKTSELSRVVLQLCSGNSEKRSHTEQNSFIVSHAMIVVIGFTLIKRHLDIFFFKSVQQKDDFKASLIQSMKGCHVGWKMYVTVLHLESINMLLTASSLSRLYVMVSEIQQWCQFSVLLIMVFMTWVSNGSFLLYGIYSTFLWLTTNLSHRTSFDSGKCLFGTTSLHDGKLVPALVR